MRDSARVPGATFSKTGDSVLGSSGSRSAGPFNDLNLKLSELLPVTTIILLGLMASSVSLADRDLIQDNGDGFGLTVGSVSVTDNGGTLNVAFAANSPYLLVEAHAAAGLSCDDIPQNNAGNPVVGQFEAAWESAGLPGSSAINLTLSNTFPEGAEVCVAAHAVVYDSTGGTTPEEAFINTAESAWANGDQFPGRNWATHFQFSLTPPSCSNGASCTVFVSSLDFTGDLVAEAASLGLGDFGSNGIGAGDAICNSLAQTASLPGTYRAWLSASVATDPESRFVHAAVPYVRTDHSMVALSWADLIDASLLNPINFDEAATSTGFATVWAATSPIATYDGLSTCMSWTSTTAAPARYGRNDLTDSRWTEWLAEGTCANLRKLYCFQQ